MCHHHHYHHPAQPRRRLTWSSSTGRSAGSDQVFSLSDQREKGRPLIFVFSSQRDGDLQTLGPLFINSSQTACRLLGSCDTNLATGTALSSERTRYQNRKGGRHRLAPPLGPSHATRLCHCLVSSPIGQNVRPLLAQDSCPDVQLTRGTKLRRSADESSKTSLGRTFNAADTPEILI